MPSQWHRTFSALVCPVECCDCMVPVTEFAPAFQFFFTLYLFWSQWWTWAQSCTRTHPHIRTNFIEWMTWIQEGQTVHGGTACTNGKLLLLPNGILYFADITSLDWLVTRLQNQEETGNRRSTDILPAMHMAQTCQVLLLQLWKMPWAQFFEKRVAFQFQKNHSIYLSGGPTPWDEWCDSQNFG